MGIGTFALIAAAAAFAQPAPIPAGLPSCSAFETPGHPPVSYDVFIIFFDRDSAAITAEAARILDNVARAYRPLSHCQLNVAAHTDRAGSDAYNLALSQRRGQAVIAYLRERGVHATPRIEALGEAYPLVETPDGAEEHQNRRAEIVISRRLPQ